MVKFKFVGNPNIKEYKGELLKVVYEVIVPVNKPSNSPFTGEEALDKMINPVKNGVDVLESQKQGYKWLGKKVFKVEKVLSQPELIQQDMLQNNKEQTE